MRKEDKFNRFIRTLAILLLAMILLTCLDSCAFEKKVSALYEETLDEKNRENAIMSLSELKGKTEMIQYISWNYVSNPEEVEKILKSQLEVVESFKNDRNPYLKDFKISITASEIGDICDEIISQIDEKLQTIRFGEKETEGD